jgi:hypothetical protein
VPAVQARVDDTVEASVLAEDVEFELEPVLMLEVGFTVLTVLFDATGVVGAHAAKATMLIISTRRRIFSRFIRLLHL